MFAQFVDGCTIRNKVIRTTVYLLGQNGKMCPMTGNAPGKEDFEKE
jgi:hypothetical protein